MKNTEKERFSGSKGAEKRSFVYELQKQKQERDFPLLLTQVFCGSLFLR